MCMFRLTDFEGEEQDGVVFNKADCKEHKLEKTKGLDNISSPVVLSSSFIIRQP